MGKLIKLEWRKNRISRYVRNAAFLAVVLGAFIFALAFLGIANDPNTGVPDMAPGHEGISSAIELFTAMSYLVFTSVMLSTFIISSYKNGTMALMFSYPIKRQKILASQMLAVWIICFTAMTLTKIFLYGCIWLGAQFMNSSFLLDFAMGSAGFYCQAAVQSAVTVSMGFTALFVGLLTKSSKAAIVFSFVLFFLTQANVGELTLANNAIFPAILTAASLLFAFFTVFFSETKGLI